MYICLHKTKNSLRRPALRLCAMSLIHFPLRTASLTVLSFLVLCWKSSGKRDAGICPSIQLECQKETFRLSWSISLVAAANRAISVLNAKKRPFVCHGASPLWLLQTEPYLSYLSATSCLPMAVVCLSKIAIATEV